MPYQCKMYQMTRRTFLATSMGATMGATLRAQTAGTGIPLGYDTYSVRAFGWKDFQYIDHAAHLGLDALQMSSLDDFVSLEPAHLKKVKDHADRLGLRIEAGIGCICPASGTWNPKFGEPREYLLKGLEVCQRLGSRSLRCFMGNAADRRKAPIASLMEMTIKILRSIRQQALDAGLRIALENHSGDLQAHEVRTIIEEAGKDFMGACLDTANAIWVVEDPMVTLEVLAPYTLTTHIRDAVVFEHPRGAAGQWVALGEGSLDFVAFLERFKQLCPGVAWHMEVITGRPPTILPYLEDEFWKFFPTTRASEFARFVALVKRGKPFMGRMIIADTPGPQPEEFRAALREQQRLDLERSVEYAKNTLGVGVRGRTRNATA